MGAFKKHKWSPLCCHLCERRAGVPFGYGISWGIRRAKENKLWHAKEDDNG